MSCTMKSFKDEFLKMCDSQGQAAFLERPAENGASFNRWGQFIINNRNGYDYFNKFEFPEHNLDQKYPITIGRIADRKATDVADELLRLGKTLNSLDRILNSTYPQQIVFHTQYAVGYIKKIVYSPVQGGR